MKRLCIAVNIVMLCGIITFDILYSISGLLLEKALASGFFLLECAFNTAICVKKRVKLNFPILLLTGIALSFAADIALQIDMIIGMLLFGTGHIFFFISYCKLEKFIPKDIIPAAVSIVGLLVIILFAPFLDFGGDTFMHAAVCVYAVIISFMTGKSISNIVRNRSLTNKIVAAGSCLFWISDFALMLNLFGNIGIANYICLFTYYPGQFVLALSPLVYAVYNSKQTDLQQANSVK